MFGARGPGRHGPAGLLAGALRDRRPSPPPPNSACSDEDERRGLRAGRLAGRGHRHRALAGRSTTPAARSGRACPRRLGFALVRPAQAATDVRTFAFISDGELEEGQVWEAAMFAAHHRLDRLTVLLDANNSQVDGPVDTHHHARADRRQVAAFGWDGQRPRRPRRRRAWSAALAEAADARAAAASWSVPDVHHATAWPACRPTRTGTSSSCRPNSPPRRSPN